MFKSGRDDAYLCLASVLGGVGGAVLLTRVHGWPAVLVAGFLIAVAVYLIAAVALDLPRPGRNTQAADDLALGRKAYELAQRMTEQLADARIDEPALWIDRTRSEAGRKRADKADNQARTDHENRTLARFEHNFQVPLSQMIVALSQRGALEPIDTMKINWSRNALFFVHEVPEILVLAASRLRYPPD